MRKAKKLIVLALTCVMLLGSSLAAQAATAVQDVHIHEGAKDSNDKSSVMATEASTIYRTCGNKNCSVYGSGFAPFDHCIVCDFIDSNSPYHCRYCGWNPTSGYCFNY